MEIQHPTRVASSCDMRADLEPDSIMTMRILLLSSWISVALLWGGLAGQAQGIPEPPLVLYGTVRNTADHNIRLTYGTLTWQFKKVSTGRIVTVTTQLTNVLDQFSYVVQVPCESFIAGVQISSNAIDVTPTPAAFDRSVVLLDTNVVSFATPTLATTQIASAQRGRLEQVDLLVSSSCVDSDGNGLCDDWELRYFGYIGVDPNADEDLDGATNREEFLAGTNPIDPLSFFKFVRVSALANGGAQVEWSSFEGRVYALDRSTSITEGFVPIKTGLLATPPVNVFRDATASGTGPYFYRVRLQ